MRQVFDLVGYFIEVACSVEGINSGKFGLCDGLAYINNSLKFLAVLRPVIY